ncbi:hypothetical protein N0V93_000424 [Gnomoniopsis smithogilvyi]|uniref:CENP-V/GFA domain-containing protein n=1 Tax=Gnomoniopsis smithogilvyi TaxID=1191159 RepID=A0A9W8Z265_9PEZI|nr:hypothetical protein N0V93_000424 [Gnomoniopsis smithogilvyi]
MAVAANQDKIEITAQCLCKAHSFTATVCCSSLPLKASACHCNSCRHVTGAMYSVDVPWPGDHDAVRNSTLRKYGFSERLKVLFCDVCSSTMFWEQPKDEKEVQYGVFTGVLLNDGPENLIKLTGHIFVADTLDGGATPWLQKPNGDGTVLKRWAGRTEESEELSPDWPGKKLPDAGWRRAIPEVPIRCHCKGVDLVFRQAEALEENTSKEPTEVSQYIDPISRKPVAGLDACNSCRTSFGVDFFNWTFVSLRHVGFPAQGSKLQGSPSFPTTLEDLHAAVIAEEHQRDPRLGTLSVYKSSDGVKRYFCSRCSACVFYAADRRHDVVNIAVGLFHSPGGARAEETFFWLLGGPVQHRDDLKGGWRDAWLKAVEAESEAWRVERTFPEWWRLRNRG